MQQLKVKNGECVLNEQSHLLSEESDVKASVAVLSFIFGSAAKYDVDTPTLVNELQQLGLPNGIPCVLDAPTISANLHYR